MVVILQVLSFTCLVAINREMKHQHLAIANHSPNQQRKFFALAADLNYSAEEVKRRAKLHFNLGCFNALTVTQMNELIERLLLKLEEREREYARSKRPAIFY